MAPVTRGGNGAHVRVNKKRNKRATAKTATIGVAALREQPGLLGKIAREIGLQRQATSKWVRVPSAHVLNVARISGISVHRLRPDLYPEDWQQPRGPAKARRRD
jgi:hypothetical protein